MDSVQFAGHVDLYLANPLANAVLLMQRCFWAGTTSDVDETLAVCGGQRRADAAHHVKRL